MLACDARFAAVRIFNTEGPIVPKDHYCIRPLDRVDLDEILALIRWKKYFVLHAPRQIGETTVLGALLNEPNNSGKYRCVYVNVEVGQAAHNDVGAAMRAILYVLAEWSAVSRKPLVLLIDEIDSLVGDTLISVPRQLRSGYRDRPRRFPQSIVLCSVRDVRDYRIRSSSGEIVLGGSACKVKAESLCFGGVLEGRSARAARPGLRGRSRGRGLAAHPRPALAGERPSLRGLLPKQGRPRP